MSALNDVFPLLPLWGFPLHLPRALAVGDGVDGDAVARVVEPLRENWVRVGEQRGLSGLEEDADHLVHKLDQLDHSYASLYQEALRLAALVEPDERFQVLLAQSAMIPGFPLNLPRRDGGDRTLSEHEQALLDLQNSQRESPALPPDREHTASALSLSLGVLRNVQHRQGLGLGNQRADWQELYEELGASPHVTAPYEDEKPNLDLRGHWYPFGRYIINRLHECRADGLSYEDCAERIATALVRSHGALLRKRGVVAAEFSVKQLRRVRGEHDARRL